VDVYLKSLTLKGFKSFAQPTTFAFEPGVTCVVGPNGSGKSNVVDALAWVMGEQGAKTLRGGKMEDVIFAGTSTRGPLGRAEVILTIDNSDGALPIEYTEVTISRTLFRNGGSEYAINGKNCRLLDVQELLSDSGLGREMHVIVGQGQLDAVLRATPEERRGFIEEAAGILKHRRRKEKTLRKLDAMQANLTRLSDLAGEIRRQLKPLGHQAEIAREAQSIAAIVRDAKARLLADDVVALRDSLARHGQNEAQRKTERILLQEQLDSAKLRELRLEQMQVGDAVDTARRVAFGLESVQERLRGLYNLANQRLSLLGSQLDSADVTPAITTQMVDDAREEARRLTAAIAEAETAWQQAQRDTVAARGNLDALDEEISFQSSLISRHDLELSKLGGQADTAASRLAAVRGEVLRQQNALDAARARRDAARNTLELAEDEATLNQAVDTDLDARYQAAQQQLTAAETEIDALRDSLHTLERERDALAARRSALSSALDQKDGSAALVAARRPGISGLVAEHVQVKPGYEAAIAAALGTLSDAVIADQREDAVAALAHAADEEMGRIALVIAQHGETSADPTSAAAHAIAAAAGVTANDAISAADAVTAPAGILALLSRVVIAEDEASAERIWAALHPERGGRGEKDAEPERGDRGEKGAEESPAESPGSSRWTDSAPDDVAVITKAGDVVSRYVMRAGSGARRSRLELVADRDAAADRLAELTGLIESARFALAEQRATVQAAKQQSTETLAALREYDSQLAAQSERLNRARTQAESAEAEAQRLERGLALATESVAGAVAAAEKARAELDVVRSRPRPMLDASAREGLSGEVDAAREREIEARLRVETARERVRAQQLQADQLARQLEADRAAADEAARRAVIRRRQVDAAQRVIAALPAVLDAVDRSVSEARLQLAEREAERSKQNAELAELRRAESDLRERLHGVSESVHGLEMQIYEKKLQLTTLLERAATELGLVEDVLVGEYGPALPVPADGVSAATSTSTALASSFEPPTDDAGTPYVRAEQERRLAKAERKMSQLGRVNPLALEEFAALEQRHKFLSEQLTDLTNTRRDLLTIIEEIDEKMQHIFSSAFDDTREAFGRVFPILFPGGTGSIFLTDPDNLLTTGIEVTVKPAGKKIERLSLLSGGERSLAAVALLIAIFKARPSPFYIMDEVEAALDDANLGRLLTIFEDLRENSQLIVITHQKRTMEIADALYGVSMRADGISAVVGQRVVQPEERAS
jgi:chromosome segregation protein